MGRSGVNVGWGAGGPQRGFRVFTFSTFATPRVEQFISEFRARALAYAWMPKKEFCRPAPKFVYVPAVANICRQVLNKNDSIVKASHVWPLLPVRFYLPGGGVYGNTAARVVIDFRKREVRIPFLGIRVRLRESLADKLLGLLNDDARPRFVAQLVLAKDGMGRKILKINLVATRYLKPRKSGKRLLVGVDMNSKYGVTVVALSLNREVRLAYLARIKPPNNGVRRRRAAELQRLAALIGDDRYVDEAAVVRRKERKLNRQFVREVVSRLRKLGKTWASKGYSVVLLVDKPDSKTLKGTRLQGTLNSLAKALENMCLFEGYHYREVRASGKLCPVCGRKGTKLAITNGKRIYACSKGHMWDRDYAASWNAVIKHLSPKERKKASKLLAELGPWALGAPPKLPLRPSK